jgi:hypothetical protein
VNLQCLPLTLDREVIRARALYRTKNSPKSGPKARQQEVAELDRADPARPFIARTYTLARGVRRKPRNRGRVR